MNKLPETPFPIADVPEAPDIKRTVFSEQDIQDRIAELGAQITRDYAGKDLVMVCVLKGTLYFFADLTRCVHLPAEL